jgi:hypothetical protein
MSSPVFNVGAAEMVRVERLLDGVRWVQLRFYYSGEGSPLLVQMPEREWRRVSNTKGDTPASCPSCKKAQDGGPGTCADPFHREVDRWADVRELLARPRGHSLQEDVRVAIALASRVDDMLAEIDGLTAATSTRGGES